MKTIKEMIEVMEWFEGGGAVESVSKVYEFILTKKESK